MTVLLYGANGYTGRLIAKEAKTRDIDIIIAGRNEEEIKDLAKELQVSYRIFNLDNIARKDLDNVSIVLNCAGPFSKTAEPMIRACIDHEVHYLDITGEINVFEYAQSVNEEAENAGIVILPGVGFDVVPTDCLSLLLKQQLPEGNQLKLSFYSKGGLGSQGTRKTSIEGIAEGVRVRKNGEIKQIPLASDIIKLDFGTGDGLERTCMAIPWGDVSTAFYTTGVPNIRVYMPIHPRRIKWMKFMRLIRPFLKLGFIQKLLKWNIERGPKGPDEETRRNSRTYVWGQICNTESNECLEKRMITPNGYQLTIDASLKIVEKIKNEEPTPGFNTPAGMFGTELLNDLDNIEFID